MYYSKPFYFISEFDNQVQESKDKAHSALAIVPEIKRLIDEAQAKTINAQEALAGAENNAQNARFTAQETQLTFAGQASQVNSKVLFFYSYNAKEFLIIINTTCFL